MTKSDLCEIMDSQQRLTEYYRETILTHELAVSAINGFHDLLFEYPPTIDGNYLIEILKQDGYQVDKLSYGLKVSW